MRQQQASKIQVGDTLIMKGEKTIIVKEVHVFPHWVWIMDDKNFNYTHTSVLEIVKSK